MKAKGIITCAFFLSCASILMSMEWPEIRKKASESEIKRKTKLHWQLIQAIVAGNLFAVNQLVEQGADVNVVDVRLKTTPLYTAISFGEYEIMKYLLQNGADITLGKNVLYAALGQDNLRLIEFLVNLGVPITDEVFREAVMRSSSPIINYLRSMMPPKRK